MKAPRLTIHSCAKCKKQQIHLDTGRFAAVRIESECPCHPESQELVDTIPPYQGEGMHNGYGEPIWITFRKCRECGTQIQSTSHRMVKR